MDAAQAATVAAAADDKVTAAGRIYATGSTPPPQKASFKDIIQKKQSSRGRHLEIALFGKTLPDKEFGSRASGEMLFADICQRVTNGIMRNK